MAKPIVTRRVLAVLPVAIVLGGAVILIVARESEPTHSAHTRQSVVSGDGGRPPTAADPLPPTVIWANDEGMCTFVEGRLECCGEGPLDGLTIPGVRGLWMGGGLRLTCYTKGNGGGECIDGDQRAGIPERVVADTAVRSIQGLCVLTQAGSVECLSEGTWRVVLERAQALEKSFRYTFALSDGDIWCWGEDPFEICEGLPATKLTNVGDITQIAANQTGHVCGVRAGGSVLCWGGPAPSDDAAWGGWGPDGEHATNTPRYIEGIAPIRWLRSAGYGAFCGGDSVPDETLQCWGIGPAPLLGVPRNGVVVGEPWTFFRGREVRLDEPVTDLTGSRTLGCYRNRNGLVSCTTTSELLHERCGATLLAGPPE